MKSIIIALNKKHLKKLLQEEIKLRGNECDLNHIDVFRIEDMKELFYGSNFNDDISQWDVSKVERMDGIFSGSAFNDDITNWKPYNLYYCDDICDNIEKIPYWAKCQEGEVRYKVIDSYHLQKELGQKLSNNNNIEKKLKI